MPLQKAQSSRVESSGSMRYLNAGLRKTNLKAIAFQVIICMQEILMYETSYPEKEGLR